MRKLFVLVLLQIAFAAGAQTIKTPPSKVYRPFKVTVAAGYAAPINQSGNKSLSKPGFVFSIEPQYGIVKNLDLGFRVEQAFIQRPEYIDNVIYYGSNAKYILSGIVTVNYKFNVESTLKPYLGVGAGFVYADPSQQVYKASNNNTIAYPLPTTTNFGGLGRIGVKFGVAHLEAAYNLIGDTSVHNTSTGLTLTASNSYFTVKAGLTIGGGSR